MRLTFRLKLDLEILLGYFVLNLMLSELCDQLAEDVVYLLGAEKLRVFSLYIFKGKRLSGFVGVL